MARTTKIVIAIAILTAADLNLPRLLPTSHTTTTAGTVSSARQTAILTGHTNYVMSVAWSPDGKTLATGSLDDTVRLWTVS